MSLSHEVVARELRLLDFGAEIGPYGFSLGPSARGQAARLRCGSGIGGANHRWRIVAIRGNEVFSDLIYTKAQLRRAVMEYLAGPKPSIDRLRDCTQPKAVRIDDETIRRRFESSGVPESPFVWKWRLKKRPLPKVQHYGWINHR